MSFAEYRQSRFARLVEHLELPAVLVLASRMPITLIPEQSSIFGVRRICFPSGLAPPEWQEGLHRGEHNPLRHIDGDSWDR